MVVIVVWEEVVLEAGWIIGFVVVGGRSAGTDRGMIWNVSWGFSYFGFCGGFI